MTALDVNAPAVKDPVKNQAPNEQAPQDRDEPVPDAGTRPLSGQVVLVLGATSAMARALAAELARDGAALHLAGRDTAETERIAQDLAIRYRVPTAWSPFEARRFETHAPFVQDVVARYGRLDGVVVALGLLGDQHAAAADFEQAHRIIDVNYTGVVSVLTAVANVLEAQRHGFIVGLASVAGDRGRQSNYVYGSAKGGMHLFLQGLRNRLSESGVHVLTVKPGFVDTKMTYGMPGLFLVASPERVGATILKALRKKRDVIYVPWFWAWIMRIIRSVPERIFKKLKL